MKIGHFASGLFNPGGISNYIQRVSRAQQESGHEVLLFDLLGEQHNQKASLPEGVFVQYVSDDTHLLQKACALEVDVLHLHTAVAVGERPPLTVIRTLHGHQPYCPSGSRYLARPGKPCDRAYSVAGCLWGHFVNRCGSVRM